MGFWLGLLTGVLVVTTPWYIFVPCTAVVVLVLLCAEMTWN